MILAVLSDTHVPTRSGALPGRVYEVCCEADLILHLGDFVEEEVYRDLQRFAPVLGVRGNMDDPALQRLLPETLTFTEEGFRLCMTHGSGPRGDLPERVRRKTLEEKPDILLFGHSHTYTEIRREGLLLLNPGAVADGPGNRSMAILTLMPGKNPEVERIVF